MTIDMDRETIFVVSFIEKREVTRFNINLAKGVLFMARRRFISKDVLDHPDFDKLSSNAVKLYVYLVVNADDDGFIVNESIIRRGKKCTVKALRELIDARFIIKFDSGVTVIRHWGMMNHVSKDKYHPTNFRDEKKMLFVNDLQVYEFKSALPPDTTGEDDAQDEKADDFTAEDLFSAVSEAQAPSDGPANNQNPEQDTTEYSSEFEALWKEYPKKKDKQKAYIAYQKRRRQGVDFHTMVDKIQFYRFKVNRHDIAEKNVMYASTFFNKDDIWRN